MAVLQDIHAALASGGGSSGPNPEVLEAIERIGREIAEANSGAIEVTKEGVRVLGVKVDFLRRDVLEALSVGFQGVHERFDRQGQQVEVGFTGVHERLDVLGERLQGLTPGILPPTPPTYWAGSSRPERLAEFRGRDDDLAFVKEAFDGGARLVVLAGGPGIGKSQLAAEYSHGVRMDGFWTPAGDTAVATVGALAPYCLGKEEQPAKDEPPEDIARRVAARLATLPGGLWVVDNLPPGVDLNDLTNTAGSFRVLVTTRDAREHLLPAGTPFRILDVLSPDEAVGLLCSRWREGCAWREDDPALPQIAEAVGRLPLALAMLAARVAAPRVTPEAVLRQLKNARSPDEIKTFTGAPGEANIKYPEAVYNAILGTLEALKEQYPADRDAIAALGYLADAPIPQQLLDALTGLDGDAAGDLIEHCQQWSVLRDSGEAVVVHALTAAVIAATNAEGVFAVAWERGNDRLKAIHTDDPVAMRAEAAHHAALLAASVRSLGLEHPDTLRSRNNLAIGYRALGRTAEAVALDEETLRVMERVLGPEHPDTLSSRNNLALGYGALGRTAEAVALDEETLRVMERVLGPEHPDTLTSRNNLANGYYTLGGTADAVALWEETMRVMERVLDPEHPDTLRSRSNLAIGYRTLGRTTEAVALDEERLRVEERVLGPEHPDTLRSRTNLANGYWALGRTADAVALWEETLRVMERVLGPEHPDTLTSRNNLAVGYRALGRTAEAVALDEETLRVRERVLGPEHPDTLTSRNNLAVGYWAVGRREESNALDEETLQVMERALGPEHPDTLTSRNNLAIGYRALGRTADAEALESGGAERTEDGAGGG